jgi:hypothetical protein
MYPPGDAAQERRETGVRADEEAEWTRQPIGGSDMQDLIKQELAQARRAYRDALRQYGTDGTADARDEWVRAGERLAAAVRAHLRL